VSRRIGGTERHGRLRVIVRCTREKNDFCEICLHGCGRMFLGFTYKLCKKQGACVTPQNVTQWRTD
jgi:hypothetical protein